MAIIEMINLEESVLALIVRKILRNYFSVLIFTQIFIENMQSTFKKKTKQILLFKYSTRNYLTA